MKKDTFVTIDKIEAKLVLNAINMSIELGNNPNDTGKIKLYG